MRTSRTPNLACKAKMRRSAALGRGWTGMHTRAVRLYCRRDRAVACKKMRVVAGGPSACAPSLSAVTSNTGI